MNAVLTTIGVALVVGGLAVVGVLYTQGFFDDEEPATDDAPPPPTTTTDEIPGAGGGVSTTIADALAGLDAGAPTASGRGRVSVRSGRVNERTEPASR